MGSLVRSGIVPGLSGEWSWKNCKYKMTKYKKTNIKTWNVQIHPKSKLENLSYGLSRSKWHFPWAFRNRRSATDILSRSGLHKFRTNEIQKFFRPNLIWGFRAKCFIESMYAFYQCWTKRKSNVFMEKTYLTEINILRHLGSLNIWPSNTGANISTKGCSKFKESTEFFIH